MNTIGYKFKTSMAKKKSPKLPLCASTKNSEWFLRLTRFYLIVKSLIFLIFFTFIEYGLMSI